MKALVIDDEEDVRSIAAVSLNAVGGMTVVEAPDGKHGIDLARIEQPDVILLDMMLPEMDGVATLAALKSEESTRRIPVIFLTAKAMSGEVGRLVGLGAAGVIVKPFDPMRLAGEVRAILGVTV